ncbi:hypothetical protein KW784_02140 [Candidatus Parcubacteria bacterium]|nr:hypothetical protein [Candidatus Parcubacteria bacterium]
MNETDQLIEAQFNRLPPSVQKALNAAPWKSSLKEIASNNKLSPEQTENLERETVFVLYGFQNPDDYVQNLINEVPVDEQAGIAIAGEVDAKVFAEISKQIGDQTVSSAIHNTLPMIEKGEQVHDAPHAEATPAPTPVPQTPPALAGGASKTRPHSDTPVEKVSLSMPDYRYPGGTDPYREPLK